MFWAEWYEAVAIGRAAKTACGYEAAHCSTCMPPIDPPMTANSRSIPRYSIRRFWARTMSPMVTGGNSVPQGSPITVPSGSSRLLSGPVLPIQPPRTLGQMTKKRSVSIGSPGPTTVSHQPGLPVIGCSSATYWSKVSAWQTSTALDRSAFSVP